MMSFKSNRKFTRLALAATLGMAVVIGCAGTFAHAADDDDDELLDTKIFRGILKGLGLRKDEAGIDYRERSPLVLPPGKRICRRRKPTPPPRRPPTGRTIRTSSGRKQTQRGGAQAQAVRAEGVDDQPLLPSQY